MVVKVNADINAGNPAKHRSRGCHKCYSRPRTRYAHQSGVRIKPKRASVGRETSDVKDHAMEVLRVGQDAPPDRSSRSSGWRVAHNSLKARVTASAVIAKLTQGPQSIAPAITVMAKRGQNDLPNTCPVCDRNVCDGRVMVRSCP